MSADEIKDHFDRFGCMPWEVPADDYTQVYGDRSPVEEVPQRQRREFEKFKCPNCGHTVRSYFQRCGNCDLDLQQQRQSVNGSGPSGHREKHVDDDGSGSRSPSPSPFVPVGKPDTGGVQFGNAVRPHRSPSPFRTGAAPKGNLTTVDEGTFANTQEVPDEMMPAVTHDDYGGVAETPKFNPFQGQQRMSPQNGGFARSAADYWRHKEQAMQLPHAVERSEDDAQQLAADEKRFPWIKAVKETNFVDIKNPPDWFVQLCVHPGHPGFGDKPNSGKYLIEKIGFTPPWLAKLQKMAKVVSLPPYLNLPPPGRPDGSTGGFLRDQGSIVVRGGTPFKYVNPKHQLHMSYVTIVDSINVAPTTDPYNGKEQNGYSVIPLNEDGAPFFAKPEQLATVTCREMIDIIADKSMPKVIQAYGECLKPPVVPQFLSISDSINECLTMLDDALKVEAEANAVLIRMSSYKTVILNHRMRLQHERAKLLLGTDETDKIKNISEVRERENTVERPSRSHRR